MRKNPQSFFQKVMDIQRYFIRHLLKKTQWSLDLQMLLEDYRLDKIQAMINARLPEDEMLNDNEIKAIIRADPTTHGDMTGKYVEWLIKQYINADKDVRSRFFEDLYKYTEALTIYHKLKTRNKVSQKDINQIKSLDQLQAIIETDGVKLVIEGFPDTRALEENGDVIVLVRDPEIHLYDVRTHKADVALGSNTQWCTIPNSDTFQDYLKLGHIFILYAKEGEEMKRYQFHFETKQFMNEQDKRDHKWINDPRVLSALISYGRQIRSWGIALYYEDEEMLKDEEIQLKAVTLENMRKDGYALSYIDNPSEKVQLAAVKQSGHAIQYIRNPSEVIQFAAVKQDGYAIKYIKNPSERVQLMAVKESGSVIQYIRNPSEKVQLVAVKQSGNAIQYIRNPSEKIQLVAVKQNGHAIQYIGNPSEAIQLAAVKQSGYAIQYISNPSEAIQLAAVEQSGYAIQYISNPSEAIQLAAVEQGGNAIEYIRSPTPKVVTLVKSIRNSQMY